MKSVNLLLGSCFRSALGCHLGMMALGLLSPIAVRAAQVSACQVSNEAIAQLSTLRQVAVQGEDDAIAQTEYRNQQQQLANQLRNCRSQNWPQTQAIWLRLYPCDVRPGKLDEIFDRILSKGYNQVYLEVFSDGQVLLPSQDNDTTWSSVLWQPGYEQRDLLAEAIAKGRARGIRVYSWMFALNFGYTYSLHPHAEQTLARNGQGQTSLSFGSPDVSSTGALASNETFVDPYSPQAQQDYSTLVQAILKRQPDGVLFDYLRYPRGTGSATIASKVQDLWIYGNASQEALFQRAQNDRGRELIRRYLAQGFVSPTEVRAIASQYPQDQEPLWQGQIPSPTPLTHDQLQSQLWFLSIAHAFQGVLDFLARATGSVQERGIPAGAVFFPNGNQTIGAQGYDARLQPWDQFPSAMEWHPMAYSTCGDMSCIVAEIQRVLAKAPPETQVIPALAGTWGAWFHDHPPLEWQMLTLQQMSPQVNAVSHFAFAWQDEAYERDRKTCRL
ncbi:MAG: family 10 glycosylhydrolase [Leptolyngbyaceae cyanobacterium CSU_1_4]|nr:family 10 glycosylhydrolase [Leptolyngbyaceae cyanobacterium CSU_1_4]